MPIFFPNMDWTSNVNKTALVQVASIPIRHGLMTYVSEALRGALVPEVPHIQPWICIVVLLFAVSVLLWVGLRGFYRRAID